MLNDISLHSITKPTRPVQPHHQGYEVMKPKQLSLNYMKEANYLNEVSNMHQKNLNATNTMLNTSKI
jgi:hypothetical protein